MSSQSAIQRAVKDSRWPVEVESNYSIGIVRDTPRWAIPPGGVYDSADFLLDQPGRAYGRGAFTMQSANQGGSNNKAVTAVASIPFTASAPTTVALVNGHLYNTTGGGAGTDMGALTKQPICNLPIVQTAGSQILVWPASDGTTAPSKVYLSTGTPTLGTLGGSPPAGKVCCVHLSYLVLAGTAANPNRLYFSPIPDVEATWDTTNAWIDFDDPISGVASVGGVLLVWSLSRLWRVLGTVPPGTVGENMQVQPVAAIGCQDARSISVSGNVAYFASSAGIYETDGSSVNSLTDKPDGTGIASYWRDTFAANFNANTVIASGIARNRWLFVSVLSPGSAYAPLPGGPGVGFATLNLPTTGPGIGSWSATAVTPGTAGNSIRVTVITGGAAGVAVSGTDITLTFVAGSGTPGRRDVQAAVAAYAPAAALITISVTGTKSGDVMSQTNLTGGTGVAAGSGTTLVCHLPTGTWQRFTNVHSYMYANYQAAAQASKLYGGWAIDAAVLDFTNVFEYVKSQAGALQIDAGTSGTAAVAVTPYLEVRPVGSGPSVKAFGHGHLTYNMLKGVSGTATLALNAAAGFEAEVGYSALPESPLAGTTAVTRKRFTVCRDAQAVSYQLNQSGTSMFTEVYLIETEVRSYAEASDGP